MKKKKYSGFRSPSSWRDLTYIVMKRTHRQEASTQDENSSLSPSRGCGSFQGLALRLDPLMPENCLQERKLNGASLARIKFSAAKWRGLPYEGRPCDRRGKLPRAPYEKNTKKKGGAKS